MDWPLAEAKNRFSEVFEKALKEGPQAITRRGKERALLVSEREFRRMSGKGRSRPRDFARFLLDDGPSFAGVKIARAKNPMRVVKL